ncbi:hypothetical protein BX616_001116 [Lobosporangium transversale]|nr:hypothetical protein BX616_001116 [Lobosporangium transversale]
MDEHAPIVYDLTQYKEETKSWNSDPSAYLLRYYTKYYFLATDGKQQQKANHTDNTTENHIIIDQETGLEILRGDQYVYQSPNKLCITGLAPTHPLISQQDRYKILNLRFDSKIQNALPQPTAIPANSKKQPPPPCQCETVICKIEALDLWALDSLKKDLLKDDDIVTTVPSLETSGSVTTTTAIPRAALASAEAEAKAEVEAGSLVGALQSQGPTSTTESTPTNLGSKESIKDNADQISHNAGPISTSASTLTSYSTPTETSTSTSMPTLAMSSLSPLSSKSSPASLVSVNGSQKNETKPRESVDPSRVIFVIRGAINGYVIELNERLVRRGTSAITDPTVIETVLQKALTHGFIAVIKPKVDKTEIALRDLCTMESYEILKQQECIKNKEQLEK